MAENTGNWDFFTPKYVELWVPTLLLPQGNPFIFGKFIGVSSSCGQTTIVASKQPAGWEYLPKTWWWKVRESNPSQKCPFIIKVEDFFRNLPRMVTWIYWGVVPLAYTDFAVLDGHWKSLSFGPFLFSKQEIAGELTWRCISLLEHGGLRGMFQSIFAYQIVIPMGISTFKPSTVIS